MRAPLDILVTDSDADGSILPAILLLRLEHSGMDYRFAQVPHQLSLAVERYISRSTTPTTVIVSDASLLQPGCLKSLQQGQHSLIDLSKPPRSGDASDNLGTEAFHFKDFLLT